MPQNVSTRTAQQVVDTVKDVCGYDINFILPDGTIAASTNPDRIGTYHEAGHQAAQKGEMFEVGENDAFYGTQKGVNLPFSWRGEIIAVIGITGDPEAVRKYAYLAQRITRLVLRERDLDSQAHTQKEQASYITRALVGGRSVPHQFLEEFLQRHGMDSKERYKTVLIKLESRYNPANLSMIEQKIVRVFEQAESALHMFDYPGEYILIESQKAFEKQAYRLKRLAAGCGQILRIGVGSDHQLLHQNRSYDEAVIAVGSLSSGQEGYAQYDDLKLEIFLGSVSEESKERFKAKTVKILDDKEKKLLKTYFECECHLKQAAEKLFIHVNTLQYQLDKIAQKTGLNPRKFEEAVVLYLGVRM